MKQKLYLITVLSITICACQAHLITPPTVLNLSDESDATIITGTAPYLGVTPSDLLRLDNLALPSGGSPFSVTYTGTGQATVTWDLTGLGEYLYGVYIFGGNGANLYAVSSDELVSSGSDQFIITPPNNGGQTPAISHILFLGGTAPPTSRVPDAGGTSLLLCLALGGLQMARRAWNK